MFFHTFRGSRSKLFFPIRSGDERTESMSSEPLSIPRIHPKTTIQVVFGDTVAITMMAAKNLSKEEYAANHPARRIGKSLIFAMLGGRPDVVKEGDAKPHSKFPAAEAIGLEPKVCGWTQKHTSVQQFGQSNAKDGVSTIAGAIPPNPQQ